VYQLLPATTEAGKSRCLILVQICWLAIAVTAAAPKKFLRLQLLLLQELYLHHVSARLTFDGLKKSVPDLISSFYLIELDFFRLSESKEVLCVLYVQKLVF
jgi:hypothetical protein